MSFKKLVGDKLPRLLSSNHRIQPTYLWRFLVATSWNEGNHCKCIRCLFV